MQAQRSPAMVGGGAAAVGSPSPARRRCEGTAMGAITLDLRPGLGVGPFTLGMPISDAFAQIEHQPNIYDVVHVKYFDEQLCLMLYQSHQNKLNRLLLLALWLQEPLKLDFVISFPDHGFHLRFDPWSQRLRLIEIYDVKRLQLRYATSLIGGPSTLATFVAVYALFGPTCPGIYDKEGSIYTLFLSLEQTMSFFFFSEVYCEAVSLISLLTWYSLAGCLD